jgi:hypothetical protein
MAWKTVWNRVVLLGRIASKQSFKYFKEKRIWFRGCVGSGVASGTGRIGVKFFARL